MTTVTCSKSAGSVPCEMHCRRIRAAADLPALSELLARQKFPSILGGNVARANTGRFSYWAADPKEVFEFNTGQTEPFVKLRKILTKYKIASGSRAPAEWPESEVFRGGWIGYFSYELGRYIEKLPVTTVDDLRMPLIRLCFYDRVIAYDHVSGDFWLFVLELPGDIERPGDKFSHMEGLLAESQDVRIAPPVPAKLDNIDFSRLPCNMTKDYYLSTVRKIKRYIFDGDVYQINFSQRFECDYSARPIDLYHWQNTYNPSGYAAYIDGGDSFIVSASPEMFIKIADGVIRTKPIKGTRPRLDEGTDASLQAQHINAQNLDELLRSAKEQAELNMIVDLERNDVARICIPGTREVVQPRTIETYPTVFHAVATIAGRLRKDAAFCDVLKAMFPGGSITGAPKIRSMEIIDETEPTARGVYTGSIGFVGIDGNVGLNIAIRTIIIKDQKAFVQTGGGIVADSDPQAEWQETITKARALLAGINSVMCDTHHARHNTRHG
ncbi:MAG TPA: anthranilate synthase component I family protein [Sedimentisphaerales bacterium]|nr:anthranilate synthase component I family protein [Sedimentisphaerales bacterium]